MNNKNYQTNDLGLASALAVSGYAVIKMDHSNNKKVGFVFEQSKELEKTIVKYWNNKLKIDALSHFNSIKMLKTRIYSSN